jgi:hypothetical protein
MAKDVKTGKPSSKSLPHPWRHAYGPRTLANLLPPITRLVFKSRAPAAVQLMSDWPALVGPGTAAIAAPRRFSGGTLTLAVGGPTALELQHLSTQLIARINTALGCQLVERLRFVQDDGVLGPTGIAPRNPEPQPVPVDGVAEGPLHDALARLGGRIAARSRR